MSLNECQISKAVWMQGLGYHGNPCGGPDTPVAAYAISPPKVQSAPSMMSSFTPKQKSMMMSGGLFGPKMQSAQAPAGPANPPRVTPPNSVGVL